MIVTSKGTTAQQLYTVDQFDKFRAKPENHRRRFELIHGEIFEKLQTERHGLELLNVGSEISTYSRQHRNGRAGIEVRYQVLHDSHNSRLPDLSFNCSRNPIVTIGSVPGMPDVAIEIQSSIDTITRMRETADYYLENGSQLVWLIYPEHRLVEVYRQNEDIEILNTPQTLSGYDVMPGFEMAVADVFADPYAPDEDEESK